MTTTKAKSPKRSRRKRKDPTSVEVIRVIGYLKRNGIDIEQMMDFDSRIKRVESLATALAFGAYESEGVVHLLTCNLRRGGPCSCAGMRKIA